MDLRVFIVLLGLLRCNWTHTVTTFLSGSVSEDVRFVHETFHIQPSKRARIGVDVSFPDRCSFWWIPEPVLGIYTTQDHVNIQKRCIERKYGQVGNRDLHPILELDHKMSRTLTCEYANYAFHCAGNITVQDFIPRNFSFAFAFHCVHLHITLKGLVYNMSISGTNETECLELDLTGDSSCSSRNHGTFPNLIGDKNLNDFPFNLFLASYTCYQHSRTFLCNLLVPKCDPESNEIIPPCREMCHEYLNGCGHIARNFTYFNCDYLPASNGVIPCQDEKVTCSFPGFVTNSYYFMRRKSSRRNYSIEYHCNDGFTMKGNSKIVCMYNGEWSSVKPVCLRVFAPKAKSWVAVSISVSILFVLAMVAVITAMICKKRLGARQRQQLSKLDKLHEPVLIFERNREPLAFAEKERF